MNMVTGKGGKGGQDSLGIRPGEEALPCNYTVRYTWELDHYNNVPGKIVGIWPTEEREGSVSRLEELKDKWGFNYMAVYLSQGRDLYDNAISAGYSTNRLMGLTDVFTTWWQSDVESRDPLWAYYTDEPVTNHGFSTAIQKMNAANTYFTNNYPNSLFISGETLPEKADSIINFIDIIMCTRYDDRFDPTDLDDLFVNPDQRPLWDEFKNQFGYGIFSQSWIAAHKDLTEYNGLLGHANNLGLTGVWLYQYDDATDEYSDDNVASFASNAWFHGWLTRVDMKWEYWYRCTRPNPCGCDPSNLDDGWVFDHKVPTYITTEY